MRKLGESVWQLRQWLRNITVKCFAVAEAQWFLEGEGRRNCLELSGCSVVEDVPAS